MRGVAAMLSLDLLRASLRQFRLKPLYSGACAGALALAVAATCASFAVVKRAFFDPLPYPDGERLVQLETINNGRPSSVSIFVLEDLKEASSPLADVAPMRFLPATYEARDSAERILTQHVTTAYFRTIGVPPALGRVWDETDAGSVVVSWSFWQRVLGGEAGAIGRRITVDGVPRVVVGVMPRNFLPPYSTTTDLWQPLDTRTLLADQTRGRRTLSVLARLSPDATWPQVDAFMDAFSKVQQATHPTVHDQDRWVVRPLRQNLVGSSRPALLGLGAAAVLLMLIVWANIAGLSAALTSSERQHVAIRAALGATQGRMFRDRLVDGLVVSAVGSLAGLWLAYAVIAVAARYQQQFLPLFAPITFEPATAMLGLVVGVVTGAFAALAPQAAIARIQTGDPLRASRGATADPRSTAVRSGLVCVQVALAIVLVVAAGLLVRTVWHLSATSMGFESAGLGYFQVNLPLPAYADDERHWRFEREVLEKIEQIPGVVAASASVGFPAAGVMGAGVTVLDRPQEKRWPEIKYFSVAPGFLSFLNLQIKEGREIEATDDFAAPRVVVINETMARTIWPDGDAIGAKVKIGAGEPTDREIVVVGIVADVRQNGPTEEVLPTAFGSTLQYSWPRRHFVIRTDGPVAGLTQALKSAVHAADPSVAPPAVTSVDETVARQTERHRLVMMTLSFFGFVAVILCGFGLYAVVALTSQFRRREYAIRVALGATLHRVRWLVVRQALVLALAGGVVGTAIAAAGTNVLQGLLYGVEPLDTATFAGAFAAVMLLAAASAWLPAWKMGQMDPVETLKAE